MQEKWKIEDELVEFSTLCLLSREWANNIDTFYNDLLAKFNSNIYETYLKKFQGYWL